MIRASSPVFCTVAWMLIEEPGSTRSEQVWVSSRVATCALCEAPRAVVATAKIVAPTSSAVANVAPFLNLGFFR